MKKILLALIYVEVLQNGINLKKQKNQLTKMLQEMEDLKNEVSETKGIMLSAKVLIVGLKKRLDEAIASQDWGQVKAVTADLSTGSDELAQAVTENAPVDPPVVDPQNS